MSIFRELKKCFVVNFFKDDHGYYGVVNSLDDSSSQRSKRGVPINDEHICVFVLSEENSIATASEANRIALEAGVPQREIERYLPLVGLS